MKVFISLLLLMFFYKPVWSQELYTMLQGTQSHVSSMENINGLKGQGGKSNAGAKGSAFTTLKAGESKTLLDVKSAGIIQRLWFTVNDRSPEMLRSLRLRIYWDGSREAVVDVPFGDFFCAGVKAVAFQSALFSDPEGRSFNCYIPMPFKTGAKVVLTNEGSSDLSMLFFDIDYVTVEKPAADMLYFHACWTRASKPVGEDAVLLPVIKGKGRFLGVSVALNVNPVYGPTWWGEGEVKMYIDGDTHYPTINGTGAEDYIGTGWGEGVFFNSYQGCLVADEKAGQYAFYRFHVPDAIYFYKDFKATIQQLGGYFAPVVRDLQAKGVNLIPVSLNGKTFRGLLEPGVDTKAELAKADPNDWACFYRSDDYAVTAYYFLDRP